MSALLSVFPPLVLLFLLTGLIATGLGVWFGAQAEAASKELRQDRQEQGQVFYTDAADRYRSNTARWRWCFGALVLSAASIVLVYLLR